LTNLLKEDIIRGTDPSLFGVQMAEERKEERENALRPEDELVWARELDDPAMRTLQDKLMEKFRFFLERVEYLIWDISEYGIYYKDEIVYENTEAKSSLAFRLYREGLEQIRFKRGLKEWELVDFLDVIKEADTLNSLEDDLITLLWERDCRHIHYVAVPYHLEEFPIEFAESIEDFRKTWTPGPLPAYQQVELIREHGLDPSFSHQRLEGNGFEVSKDQVRVQSEEMEALREKVGAETEPGFYFHAIRTLFEVMPLEKETQGFDAIGSFLNRVIKSLLERGDFREASQILRRLYILLNSYKPEDWQSNLIKKTVIEAGEPERIEIIGDILRKDEFPDLKGAFDYFLMLQRNSIPHLCELLGTLSSSKPRRIICDALSKVGKNGVERMAPFLEDERWYLVRNIVYIFGRIGRKEAIPYIAKALQHTDVRVRREALQALGFIGGSDAMQHMIRSLEDKDVKIRGVAALNLGRMGEEALASLTERMLSKEFHKKELEEIKAFFKAIGMIRSNNSIPVLYSFLEGKKWFGRAKADEIRGCAIESLVRIGTPEAKEVLEAGAESRDEFLRAACRIALLELS
jgi:HEAT repeat protein